MGEGLRFSPLEYDPILKRFNFGGSGVAGLLIAAMNTTGNVFYVDNGNGQAFDGLGKHGMSPSKPLKTLDYAIGRCTANNGDFIIVMPGHAENISSAGAITADIAGVNIIGLGEGAARPTITWNSSDNSATFAISAASVGIYNILGVCGDDGLTTAFNITGDDCTVDITWRDPTDVEAAACITATSMSRLTAKVKYEGYSGGNACVAPIILKTVAGAEIDVNFYGKASTAVVNFQTGACTNVNVRGYFYVSGTTDLSKNVVDTIGGSTWSVDGFDGAAGCAFSGGSGNAVAKDDVGVMISDWATFASQVSDLTIIASDFTTTVSDLIAAGATAIASDIVIVQSDVKSIGSDLIVTNAIVDTIASDTVIVLSDLKVVAPKITTIASDLVVALSDTTKIESDLADVQSDIVVILSDTTKIESDLIAVNARVTTIASDLVGFRSAWDTFETLLSDFVVKYTSDNP